MPHTHEDRMIQRKILAELGRLREAVGVLIERVNAMASDLTALQAAVANEGTVVQSAITLLTQLSQQISDLKNDPAELQALADGINSQASALAAAVQANTPAAPAAPPAPATPPATGG